MSTQPAQAANANPPISPLEIEALSLFSLKSAKRLNRRTDISQEIAISFGSPFEDSATQSSGTIAVPSRYTNYVLHKDGSQFVGVTEEEDFFSTELRGDLVAVRDKSGNSIHHDNYQEVLMITQDNSFRYTHDFRNTQVYESTCISALGDEKGFNIFLQTAGSVKAFQVTRDGRLLINPFNSSTWSMNFSKPSRYVILEIDGESFNLAQGKFIANSGKKLKNENIRLVPNRSVYQIGQQEDRLLFSPTTNEIAMFAESGPPILTYGIDDGVLQIGNMKCSRAATSIKFGHLNVDIDLGKRLMVNGAVISNALATKSESKELCNESVRNAKKAISGASSAKDEREKAASQKMLAKVLAQLEIAKQYCFSARCLEEMQEIIDAQKSILLFNAVPKANI